MLEIPSAFFDLENIINLGIDKLVVGMNDLTSFVFATVRNSELHNMKSPIMLNIINLGIDKLVVGMNDLTSFVFATVRNSELHNMKSPIMLNIIKKAKMMCDNKNINFAIAGYFIDELNKLNIISIIHYSYIPDIFNKAIKYPNHLDNIKNIKKK